ncbi:MAG: hypothetical protein ACK449_07825 [Planctomycetota bacterium]|jgi:hypothetical protein
MNQRRSFFVMILICLFTGCQYKVAIMGEPVSVSGKLTKDGKPLGNVTLMLQPVETGHMVPMAVGSDGAFKGTVVPGKYAYYLAASDGGDASALNALDASLQEAKMTRTVTVQPGQASLNVEL